MILITGANGQLGNDFKKLLDSQKMKYIGTDIRELDITSEKDIEKFVDGKNIDLIINCAAYNNVDEAEEEYKICEKLNTKSPEFLARIAKKIGAEFVTYSTDFVFDGEKGLPYTEKDLPNPLSVYGSTKFQGEKNVLNLYEKVFVVRTSWVFGIGNNNFNKQVINWSKGKNKLAIVDDQISSPTYSKDLAEFTWELIKTKKYGLYHFSNSGEASKYDQANYILKKIGWDGELKRAKTSDFKLKAKRAKYTKLCSEKIEKVLNKKIPTWESGIDRFLKELN